MTTKEVESLGFKKKTGNRKDALGIYILKKDGNRGQFDVTISEAFYLSEEPVVWITIYECSKCRRRLLENGDADNEI